MIAAPYSNEPDPSQHCYEMASEPSEPNTAAAGSQPQMVANSPPVFTPLAEANTQKVHVPLKLLNPRNKRKFTMYNLRNIRPVLSCDEFKEQIFFQRGDKVVSGKLDFEFGYLKDGKKYW